jgi:hypothetical protein
MWSSTTWGTVCGPSFCIGGVSFYMAAGVSPEIVRITGQWKSLTYEVYIRRLENVIILHMGGIGMDTEGDPPYAGWVGGATVVT